MGMVLSFVPSASASGNRQTSAGERASVIIFPGVRQERIKAEDRVSETAQKPAH